MALRSWGNSNSSVRLPWGASLLGTAAGSVGWLDEPNGWLVGWSVSGLVCLLSWLIGYTDGLNLYHCFIGLVVGWLVVGKNEAMVEVPRNLACFFPLVKQQKGTPHHHVWHPNVRQNQLRIAWLATGVRWGFDRDNHSSMSRQGRWPSAESPCPNVRTNNLRQFD